MVRVTIRSKGERDIVVDDVQKVSQRMRGKYGMEETVAWGERAILSHHFIPDYGRMEKQNLRSRRKPRRCY
mgnify:CR=1 FL=1